MAKGFGTRVDLHALLDANPAAAPKVLDALNAGQIYGTDFSTCLFGVIAGGDFLLAYTLAKDWHASQSMKYSDWDWGDSAESTFIDICGHTPDTKECARYAAELVSEWLARAAA